VPINLKVILIGDRSMYELMYDYEEDFRKIFKVRVEFDEEMPMSDSGNRGIRGPIARAVGKREFVAIRSRGVRGDSGTRRADGGGQQSDGRFVDIADLAREAHYAAKAAAKRCAAGTCGKALIRSLRRGNEPRAPGPQCPQIAPSLCCAAPPSARRVPESPRTPRDRMATILFFRQRAQSARVFRDYRIAHRHLFVEFTRTLKIFRKSSS